MWSARRWLCVFGPNGIRRPDKRFGPCYAGSAVEAFRGVGGVTASVFYRIDDTQIGCAAGSFSMYDGHDQDTPSMGAPKLWMGLICIQGRSVSEMPTLNIAVLPSLVGGVSHGRSPCCASESQPGSRRGSRAPECQVG